MRLLLKDQIRKVRHNLFNFISLSLLVIIITMTFTAVQSSLRRLEANYDNYLEAQSLEDFYFSMGNIDINYLTGTQIVELCDELDITFECFYALSFPNDPSYINNLNERINQELTINRDIYERIIDGYADYFTDEYGYTYEKGYSTTLEENGFMYKFLSVTNTVNIPYLVEGELPDEIYEVTIFPEFAEENDLSIGDTITIKGTIYTITGFAYRSDFLLPMFDLTAIQFDPSKQTILIATKDTLDATGNNLFIKYHVLGDLDEVFPEFGYSNMQSNDYSVLGKYMSMVYIMMPSDINFRVIALETEIINANAFINVFLPLFIVLIAMLLLVFMKRYIEHNRHDIKVLHALGYTNQEIGLSLMVYPFFVSLMVFVGYGLGLLVSGLLFDVYSARYLFPKAGFELYSDIFFIATTLPLLFLLLVNYVFIRFSLPTKSHQPKRLLRVSKFIENKVLLSTAILFFTVSILVIFGLSGNTMFTSFVEETKTGNHYSEMINLQYMTNIDQLDSYETYTKVVGKISGVNSKALKTVQTTTVYGILPTSNLKRLINDDIEQNLLLEEGIIISDYLSSELDLSIGDEISVEIGSLDVTLPIVGVSNELIENNFYMDKELLNSYFNLDETYYNGIFATDYSYESNFILNRVDYNKSLTEMSSILNISSLIINYLVILSVVLGLFIFTLVLMNFFTDHRRDIAVFKSLGYSESEINKKYLIIIYIIMMVLYIISVPTTDYILNTLLGLIISTVGFKLVVHVSIIHMIVGLVLLNAIFIATVYGANKYYRKIPIASILKHQDI